jgi:hypothetical protein
MLRFLRYCAQWALRLWIFYNLIKQVILNSKKNVQKIIFILAFVAQRALS